MVAVWMVTYNHGEFIENAIESVMMQECKFKYKLFIGEDNSIDKTREICQKLKEKYADKIELILHEKNIGPNSNGVLMYERCFKSGAKYIALLEGDDYWTDPYKLQKQINFLLVNPNYSMCFHQVQITMANTSDYYVYPIPPSDTLYLKDILQHHYIPTCSLVFRNKLFSNGLPKWMLKSISGDIPLEILLASKGKTKYLPQVMACYRRNEGGISQSPLQIANIRTGYLYMYSKLASEIPFPYTLLLYKKIIRILLGIFKSKVFLLFARR